MSQPQSAPGADGASAHVTDSVVRGEGATGDLSADAFAALAASGDAIPEGFSPDRVFGEDGEGADGSGSGGSSDSGAGGSSAGSGGGTGAIAPTPIILLGAFSASPTPTSGPGGVISSETEPERRPTPAVAEFNQHDELVNVIATAARQRVAPAPIIDIRINPAGGAAANVPEFSRRTVFGGIIVATSPAATQAVIERRSVIDDFFAGMAARPVTQSEERPGFLSSDGDQVVSQLLRGMGAEQVRGDQLPEGLADRRSMLPQNLAQFKYEALRGAQGVEARPRPMRRDPIQELVRRSGPFVVPNSMLDEMNDAFPDAMTVGYDDSAPAIAGEILAAISQAESLILEREQEQRAQRAKLQDALRALWAERHGLVDNWDGSEQQQARLTEIDQRIGTLVGLVQLSDYARRELDSAYHATQSAATVAASTEVSDADLPAVAEVDAAVAQAERVTDTAEWVVVESADQVVAATDAIGSIDTATEVAAQDWALGAFDSPEPPQELLTGLGEAALPPEWRIADANPETGEFTLTREPLTADLDAARSPDSTIEHEGPSLDDAVTVEGAEAQPVKVIDGDFEALSASPAEDVLAPSAQPAVSHTAAGMRLQPGDDGGGDEGGGGTAASAARRRGRHRAGPTPEGIDAAQRVNARDGDDSSEDRPDAEDSTTEPGKKPATAAVQAEKRRREHVATTGQAEVTDEGGGEADAPGEEDAAVSSAATDAKTLKPEVPAAEREAPDLDERRDADLATPAARLEPSARPDREPVDDARDDRPEPEKLSATDKTTKTGSEAPADSENAKPEPTTEVVTDEAPAEDRKPDGAKVDDQPDRAPGDGEQPAEDKAEQSEPGDGEQPSPDRDARREDAEPPTDENAGPQQPEDGAAPATNVPPNDDGVPVADPNAQQGGPDPAAAGALESNQPHSGAPVESGAPVSGNQPVSGRQPAAPGPQVPFQPPGPVGPPGRTAVPTRSTSHTGPKGSYGGSGSVAMGSSGASGAPRTGTAR